MASPANSPHINQPVISPNNAILELDIEKLNSTVTAVREPDSNSSEKLEPDSLQAAAPIASAGETDEDTFTEGGLEGWKAVLGCALVIAAAGGWNMMWGTFQAYHSKNFLRGTSDATLSAIGAVQNTRFIASGCIVVFIGQFGAAWCHNFWSIFLTQGVLQGFGCGILLPVVSAIPSQWFRRHRGVATGIVVGGASFGGAVPSLIIQAMLERLGFHKTLLIYSFVQGVTMLIGFSLITTRFPASQVQNRHQRIVWVDKRFFKDPTFWSLCTSLMLTIFGFMTPFVFISVYTREKLPQTSDQLANLPISVMLFSSAIGRTVVGLIGDRIGYLNIFILVILASSFCQAILWNVGAESYAGIMMFSILFGISGPCFINLVIPVAVTLYGIHNLAALAGLLNMFYIPGSISGAPLGGVILDSSGRNWHALAAYSGLTQVLGMLCILYARFYCNRRVFAKI